MKSLLLSIIRSKTIYLLIAMLGFVFFASKSMQLSYSDFVLTKPSGTSSATQFPFFSESTESGIYRLKGNIHRGKYSSTTVRIIPDDEILGLTINSIPVNLNVIPYEARKDYNKGFIYDLKPFLNIGNNTVEIVYSDGGGLMGMVMSSVGNESFSTFLYCLLIFIALLISYKLLNSAQLKNSFKILFVGALLIRLIYFMVTPADVRDHDLGDHIGYTEHLTTHWLPPSIDHAVGGAFFHPPLYYYTGAIVYKATQIFEPLNKVVIYRVQQLLCLAYSMGFVLFGLLILERLLSTHTQETKTSKPYRPFRINQTHHNGRTQSKLLFINDSTVPTSQAPKPTEITRASSASHYLSISYWREAFKSNGLFWVIGALFVFWPVAIIHSVRIGNDPMEYFLFTASLYYILKWYNDDKKRHLMIASFIGAAAILTKANGEILVAVLAITGLYKMIKSKQYKDYFKLAIVPCLVLFTAVAITVAPGFILMQQGKRDKLYIDNIDGLSHANLVGNTAANYLWFDAKTFITEPFTDPYDDRMGRQFFWNYLGKTGLFGEFKYPSKLSTNTAIISSFLEVLMLIYIMFGIYRMSKDDFKRQAVILLSGFFLWAGITYMRMTFPANIDFRYVVPILLTFCSLYATSIMTFQRQGATRLVGIGMIMSLLFTLSGILFILGIS